MNILFITPSPPSRFQRIRSLNLIKYLCRYHTVYLVSMTQQRVNETEELGRYCGEVRFVYQPKVRSLGNCVRWLGTRRPLEVAYCHSARMTQVVKTIVRQYSIDVIYIKRLRSAQWVPREVEIPTILDTTDAMSLYYERAKRGVAWCRKPLFYTEAWRYKDYERRLLRRFRNWAVCSEVDMAYLSGLAPETTRLWLIPNGVDTEIFAPDASEPERNTLLLSGLMDKFVNVQAVEYFIKHIFPRIIEVVPDAQVYVVGPRPVGAVRGLHGGNVYVTGEVRDIREYIARSQIIVCPIKTGVGTRNKILQAWAMGRPVVTTSEGLEGLRGSDGDEVSVANGSREFAEKTIDLLQDAERRRHLVAKGLAMVREKYAMNVIINQVNDLLATVERQAADPE